MAPRHLLTAPRDDSLQCMPHQGLSRAAARARSVPEPTPAVIPPVLSQALTPRRTEKTLYISCARPRHGLEVVARHWLHHQHRCFRPIHIFPAGCAWATEALTLGVGASLRAAASPCCSLSAHARITATGRWAGAIDSARGPAVSLAHWTTLPAAVIKPAPRSRMAPDRTARGDVLICRYATAPCPPPPPHDDTASVARATASCATSPSQSHMMSLRSPRSSSPRPPATCPARQLASASRRRPAYTAADCAHATGMRSMAGRT